MEQTHVKLPNIIDIDEARYWSILNGVPPLHQGGNWFVCSEPCGWDENYNYLYSVCFYNEDRTKFYEFYHTFRNERDKQEIIKIISIILN